MLYFCNVNIELLKREAFNVAVKQRGSCQELKMASKPLKRRENHSWWNKTCATETWHSLAMLACLYKYTQQIAMVGTSAVVISDISCTWIVFRQSLLQINDESSLSVRMFVQYCWFKETARRNKTFRNKPKLLVCLDDCIILFRFLYGLFFLRVHVNPFKAPTHTLLVI